MALAVEEPTTYDREFYRDMLVRTTTSVLSPLGWRTREIEAFLAEYDELSLQTFI